jgi:hypothetical protein
MAINFPDTPTDGQVFTSGNQSWTYFSTPGVWKVTSGAIGYTGSRGSFDTPTDDTTTNATYFPIVAIDTANSTVKTSSTKLSFNPSTGVLSAVRVAAANSAVDTPSYTFTGDLNTGMWSPAADTLAFSTNGVERVRLTSSGFLEGVFSDDVVALGNSGTATSIDLRLGTVFTATLTGNCTFTLTNPNANANRGSSFTLILTNDGTADRSVAWAGGAFRFPGGASLINRTTTANAVEVWVFFTPDNGTTWYGNITMRNVLA